MAPEAQKVILPNPDEIIAAHDPGASIVTRRSTDGGEDFAIPLGAALLMEADLCTPKVPEDRLNPDKRSAYLIGILASGNSLNEEYYPLLEPLFRDKG